MTTHEILNLGFQKDCNIPSDEYTNGIVKVQINADEVTGVFVTGIKIDGINNIEELMYICKKVNAKA